MYHLTMVFTLVFVCFGLAIGTFASDSQTEVQKRILLNDNIESPIAKVDALERDFAALKTKTAQPVVACMAQLTTTATGTGHHIYYDDVKLNLGNAYNPHHGMFVPPVNGTYLVSVTACSHSGHYIVLQVNVNNDILGKVLAGDNVYAECSSKVFLGHFNAGDDVFVQHVSEGDYLMAYGVIGYPTFNVALLQAD